MRSGLLFLSDRPTENVGRLTLRLVVRPDDELRHQAEQNELDSDDAEEHRKQEKGIAVDLHILEKLLVEGERTEQPSEEDRDQAQSAEEIHGLGGKADQKLDGHQIQRNLEGPQEAVLGSSVPAGVMADRDLGYSGSRPACVDWNEPVHFSIETDMLQDFAPVTLEGASVVAEADAADPADDSIGGARWENPGQPRVLPILSPAADHIVPLVKFVQDLRNVGGIVLEIGIHGNDDPALGMIETCRQGRRLSEVASELQHQDMMVPFGEIGQDSTASVAASVVDEENLVFELESLENPRQILVQDLKIGFLVVDGNDDGQSRRGLIPLGC